MQVLQFVTWFVNRIKSSICMGFLMNPFTSSNGKNSCLNFSSYVSNAEIKHTLTLESISFNLRYNSNPVILGILISNSNKSYVPGLKLDNATRGSLNTC